MENSTEDKPKPSEVFTEASAFAEECDAIISRRCGDPNVLPYLNARLSVTEESFAVFVEYEYDGLGE
jgi:hypothetical protein